MLTSLAVIAVLLAGPADRRAQARVERVPRLAHRADLQLWRALDSAQAVFGGTRPVFVRADDAESQRVLAQLGVEVPLGAWRPARLDAGRLRAAMVGGGALSLASAPAHRPMLEVSAHEIGVVDVHRGLDLQRARTGRGVLVGIIDTGIDLSHPAFLDEAGNSRVIAVWDQDRDGNAPRELGYGHECRAQTIAQLGCDLEDGRGHGTHVAGIAAGERALGGIAPDAKIAVVRSDDFTRLADAVRYLMDVAAQRDLPLVINMSVGGQYGPHDGRTPLEQFLDDAVGEGRLIVAAAGNDGADRLHFGAELKSEPRRLGVESLPWGETAETMIEMWSLPRADVRVSAELWVGGAAVVAVPLVADESESAEAELTYGEQRIELAYGAAYDRGHDLARRTLLIDASAAAEMPSDAQLVLSLSGSGQVQGWISQSDYRVGLARFAARRRPGWIDGDGNHSIAVPASGRRVIAVGAYATRTQWISEKGGQQQLDRLIFGELAAYSSTGPTIAPAFTGVKPNISAPGSVIASARAACIPTSASTLDAARVVMQGTSMASPHVAGVLALMLEAKRDLDPKQALQILADTARVDDSTGEVPNDQWGAGKLDGLAAVQRAEAEAGGCAAASSGAAVWVLLVLLLARASARRREASRRFG